MALKGGQFFLQALQRDIVGVQGLQLIAQLVVQFQQGFGLHPMLAGKAVDAVETLLHGLLALRIGFEMIDEAIQFIHRLLDLDLGGG